MRRAGATSREKSLEVMKALQKGTKKQTPRRVGNWRRKSFSLEESWKTAANGWIICRFFAESTSTEEV